MARLFGTDGVRGVANEFPMTADFAPAPRMSLTFTCLPTATITERLYRLCI